MGSRGTIEPGAKHPASVGKKRKIATANSDPETADAGQSRCRATRLADLFGFSNIREIHKLTAEDIIPKASRGMFKFDDCVKGYIKHLKSLLKEAQGSGNVRVDDGGNPISDKQRIEKAKADKLEMELELQRGELMRVDHAIATLSQAVITTKQRILTIPSKAAPLIVGDDDVESVQETLTELFHEAIEQFEFKD